MVNKILVVDDEKEIRNLIEIYLKNEGYEVKKASNGEEAIKILEKEDIQLMILDIMMPKMDGIEVCKKVREHLSIPILMLSAKSEDMDKIEGIMTGADDYMTKPFNPLELSVRVKALLRRTYYFNNMNTNKDIINIENLTIDKNERTVKVDDVEIPFTSREFDILYYKRRDYDKNCDLPYTFYVFDEKSGKKLYEGNIEINSNYSVNMGIVKKDEI